MYSLRKLYMPILGQILRIFHEIYGIFSHIWPWREKGQDQFKVIV